MDLHKKLSGYEVEHLPNSAFRLMAFAFAIRDALFSVGNRLDAFGLKQGDVVIDFGCGPGSYIERASHLVGDKGVVYAVDVHPLAIASVQRKSERKRLNNIVPVLAEGYPVAVASHTADLIYALDMFHHVRDTDAFLRELHRLLKPMGTLFIESGHQSMDEARSKIVKSGCWLIEREEGYLFRCIPRQGGS